VPNNSSRPSLSLNQSIDNPDQRITQDADSLCRSLSTILPLILISPFTIGYYTYLTWQVTGYYGPLGILIYFIIWTGINKIFISSVSQTIFRQNNCEGNFRFLHTQIRIYNEPIAFYNGGLFEHTRFNSYFITILSPILYIRARREFALSLSTNLYDYIGSIINYLLLALAIFVFHLYDNLTLDELVKKISETSFTTGYLIYCFNKLNDLTSEVSLIAANTHRVQSFIEFTKNIDLISSGEQFNEIIQQNQILIIKNLSYSTPNNHKNILMKNLNLILNQGQRLLITGLIHFLYNKL
jgi:ATP-binding cassette subfamily D (ALD) protein 4